MIKDLKLIASLHSNWNPHPSQIEIGKQFFNNKIDTLFLQCGRKWGKTEFAIYTLWRYALLNPGKACYYITPELSHGEKINWHDPRILTFGPQKYIKSVNNKDRIIQLTNGSFFQFIGSRNVTAANGLRPGLIVYDEFCEFYPKFHATMNPNRAVNESPLLIIGTPPLQGSRNKRQYIEFANECKEANDCIWTRQESYENPYISREWLDKEKERLLNGEEPYLWHSQYEARLTAGGKNVVFPMFNKNKHLQNPVKIRQDVSRLNENMEYYCIVNPGTTRPMGVLFAAFDHYTKKVYILDEIFQKNPQKTSVNLIVPQILKIMDNFGPERDDWNLFYNQNQPWFGEDSLNNFSLFFSPISQKKEDGISTIKDMLNHNSIVISDTCTHLQQEIEDFVAKDNGKLPMTGDRLINCIRYFVKATHYSTEEVKKMAKKLGPRRLDGLQTRNFNEEDAEFFMDWTRWAD